MDSSRYCSLDEAFQELGNAPSPGCSADATAARAARKEERRKARRCKTNGSSVGGSSGASGNSGALSGGSRGGFLDFSRDQDPDRQHLNELPDVQAMNPYKDAIREAFSEESYDAAANPWLHSKQQKKYEDVGGEAARDRDPMDSYVKNEEREHVMVVPVNGNAMAKTKKFFGASGPEDEPFADYVPDQQDYRLQPDFMKAFEEAGVARAGATSAGLPTPSVNQYWKPITPTGTSQTSFIEHLPPPGGQYAATASASAALRTAKSNPEMAEMMKRIDTLFARLDDMNRGSPDQVTSEMLMFISSGIFVMFMMDLLVRKGRR